MDSRRVPTHRSLQAGSQQSGFPRGNAHSPTCPAPILQEGSAGTARAQQLQGIMLTGSPRPLFATPALTGQDRTNAGGKPPS